MLMMLARFFAHGGETEDELRLLARGTLRIMASVLRPLGEALAKTPAGPEYPGSAPGPTFGFTGNIDLLPHKNAAWIYFLERLYDLAMRLTRLAEEATLPQEVQEAAAALESVAEHLTPFIPATVRHGRAVRGGRAQRAHDDSPGGGRPVHRPQPAQADQLQGRDAARAPGRRAVPLRRLEHQAVLRRHACAQRLLQREIAGANAGSARTRYAGKEIVVLDNRGTCCHFGNCTDHLPQVFHHEGDPFVTPDGAGPDAVEAIVRACPSGALGFIKDGVKYEGEQREPEIYVAENASYYVRGGIELEGEPMNKGALREHYALCRCGQSKNKPFCDGSHWYAGFKDEDN